MRLEEREVFPLIEDTLSPEAAEAMTAAVLQAGARLAQRHAESDTSAG